MLKPIFLSEGFRMLRRRYSGEHKRFQGNAEEICSQIVEKCWNGKYFQTSQGHFCEFYTRDFGWCTESLLKLGNKEKVRNTLKYALEKFKQNNAITVAISPKGIPFDFPYYAPDSLGYLIHSLALLKDKEIIKKYETFLNKEIERFQEMVIDENGIVRKDRKFSSMRDLSVRRSSCYDNCIVARLSKELKQLKLENPFKENYKKIIKENFWNGEYFYDDIQHNKYITGDANIAPFVFGVLDDKRILRIVIETIRKEKLDRPLPLRYSNKNIGKFHWISNLAKKYETTTAWTHMGPMYIKLVKKVDRSLYQEYRSQYKDNIEHYGNYLEGFSEDGKIFKTLLYQADEGMLWAANYLTL